MANGIRLAAHRKAARMKRRLNPTPDLPQIRMAGGML
jgi:hypothetical protein